VIRIIVRTDDAAMAANVGGNVQTDYRTFDVDAPAVEAFLAEVKGKNLLYVGVEVLLTTPAEGREE
jgi:hypothetical protein